MAVFTIELVYAGSGSNFVCPYTPYLVVKHKSIYGPTEPPTVVGVEETWELQEAVLLGTDTAIRTLYEQIRTQIRDRTNQITGVLFKKDGSTVDSMTTSTHQGFKVVSFEVEKGKGVWLNHIVYNIVIRGVKGVEDPGGGDSANVTKLEIKTSYEYSKEGLLSKTQSGYVHTVGSYALARARTLGQIALPDSGLYTYANTGPEGTNVVQEDQSNRKASFFCTIIEQRNSVPTGAYKYEVTRQIEKFRHHRMIVTNFTISAATISEAETMADDLKPTKRFLGGGFTQDENTNTITGSWSEYIPLTEDAPFKSFSHSIRVSGGGHNLREYPILGGEPVLLKLPLACTEVTEVKSIQFYGKPNLDRFFEPSFEKDEFMDGPPESEDSIVEEGIDDEGYLFQRTWTWNWKFPPSEFPGTAVVQQGVSDIHSPGGDFGSIAVS